MCVIPYKYISKLFFNKNIVLFLGRSITNMYCQQVTKLIGSIGRPLKLRFKKQPNPLLLSRPLRYAVAFQKGRIGLGLKEFKEITTSKQTSSFYGSNTSKNQNFKKNQFYIIYQIDNYTISYIYYIQSFTFKIIFNIFFFCSLHNYFTNIDFALCFLFFFCEYFNCSCIYNNCILYFR